MEQIEQNLMSTRKYAQILTGAKYWNIEKLVFIYQLEDIDN